MMARDVFAVSVSIVHSESYFSSANRIPTDKCNILGVKTFERLECLKYWFDADQCNQHAPIEAPTSSKFMTETDENSDGIPKNDL
jgi:hAT family C-terminal dimerisation region